MASTQPSAVRTDDQHGQSLSHERGLIDQQAPFGVGSTSCEACLEQLGEEFHVWHQDHPTLWSIDRSPGALVSLRPSDGRESPNADLAARRTR